MVSHAGTRQPRRPGWLRALARSTRPDAVIRVLVSAVSRRPARRRSKWASVASDSRLRKTFFRQPTAGLPAHLRS